MGLSGPMVIKQVDLFEIYEVYTGVCPAMHFIMLGGTEL